MSKIGRKSIDISNVTVEIKDSSIAYKGAKHSGEHTLPAGFVAEVSNNKLFIKCPDVNPKLNKVWGLERALIANEIEGARKGFEKEVIITGLGYKGILMGRKIEFSLGYAHKEHYNLPDGITVDIDKSGQKLLVKGFSKEQVGFVCDQICSLRKSEPYKGTGIRRADKHLIRKEGKKSA